MNNEINIIVQYYEFSLYSKILSQPSPGGSNNDGHHYTGPDTWTIDFSTGQWTAGPQMINTRSNLACARLNSGLVVAAGGDGKSSIELLKPGANAWTQGIYILLNYFNIATYCNPLKIAFF